MENANWFLIYRPNVFSGKTLILIVILKFIEVNIYGSLNEKKMVYKYNSCFYFSKNL